MPKRLYLEQRLVSLAQLGDANPKSNAEWPREYVVRKVTGSTVPRVHETLTEAEANNYCADENWHVEIT